MRAGLILILSIGFMLAIAGYFDPAAAQTVDQHSAFAPAPAARPRPGPTPRPGPAPLLGGGAVGGVMIAAVWLARRLARRE
jgi:hypothetical protein